MERYMKNNNGRACGHPDQGMCREIQKAEPVRWASPFRICGVLVTLALGLSVAACSSGQKVSSRGKVDKKYGVTASPRVVANNKKIPRGGGRYTVGKPYKIAGRTYRPRVDPRYKKVGLASWYGKAFHGRLTANGEVFDMNRLTAAHTTMPLPSYARVTNTKNGRSVIVRVNDRGPFHGNREIDLSKKTADVLDFQGAGIVKVKVEYVGRARLDGRDDEFLAASYRGPGSVAPGGSYPGTQLAQLDRLPPGAVVGEAPAPQAAVRPAPRLAAYNPATEPVNRNPVGRQETVEPMSRSLGLAKAGTESLDDVLLSYGGYGQEPFGSKYSLNTLYTQSGRSYVSDAGGVNSALGTHSPQVSGGVKPSNLPAVEGLSYAPSYAPASRIDKAFLAMSLIMH